MVWHALTSITAAAGAVTQRATSVQTAAAAKHAFKRHQGMTRRTRIAVIAAASAGQLIFEPLIASPSMPPSVWLSANARAWNSMSPEQPLPPSLRADTAIAEPLQLAEQSQSSLTVCIPSVVNFAEARVNLL